MAYREEPKAPEVSAEQVERLSKAAERVGMNIEDIIKLLDKRDKNLLPLLDSIKEDERLAELEAMKIPLIQKLTDLKQQLSVKGVDVLSRTIPNVKTLLTVRDLEQLAADKELEIKVHFREDAQMFSIAQKSAIVTTADNQNLNCVLTGSGRLVFRVEEAEWNEIKLNAYEPTG